MNNVEEFCFYGNVVLLSNTIADLSTEVSQVTVQTGSYQ